MIKRLILLLTLLLCSSTAFAQIASRTAFRVRYGASLPATCNATTGMVFFLNAGAIGLYSCTATDTWAAAGAVSITGTPANNQIAVWTDASTLEGDAALTWTGTVLTLGDATETDHTVLFDGNAVDFYMALDDSDDALQIGLGSTVGTTEFITLTSNRISINNDRGSIGFGIESVGSSVFFNTDGARTTLTLGGTPQTGPLLELHPGIVASSVVTSVGVGFNINADTKTDSGATDPIAIASNVYVGQLTVSDATKVYTTASSLYIENAMAVTGGASITNAYAQWNDAGLSRFDDGIQTGEPDVGGLLSVLYATATVTTSSGSSQTASNLIPAGVFVIGVSTTVETLVTGPAGYDVGDGTTVDLWGNSILVADGTTSDITDFTADGFGQYTAANDVVITTDGVDFTAGQIRITVQYLGITAGVD